MNTTGRTPDRSKPTSLSSQTDPGATPLTAAGFHPELSTDTRVHKLFLDLVATHTTA